MKCHQLHHLHEHADLNRQTDLLRNQSLIVGPDVGNVRAGSKARRLPAVQKVPMVFRFRVTWLSVIQEQVAEPQAEQCV